MGDSDFVSLDRRYCVKGACDLWLNVAHWIFLSLLGLLWLHAKERVERTGRACP
jgi:hypothetical protein